MTTDYIAELNKQADACEEDEHYRAGQLLREYAALLAKANEGAPAKKTITTLNNDVIGVYVSVTYTNHLEAQCVALRKQLAYVTDAYNDMLARVSS